MAETLLELVTRYTDAQIGESPFQTEIDGLAMLRSDYEKRPSHFVHKPALCAVLQGTKWTMFGSNRIVYRPGQAVVVGVEMPAVGRVTEASPNAPFIGVAVALDVAAMRDVLESLGAPPAANGEVGSGVFVADFSGPLEDCMLRLVRLLGEPAAIPILYPAIMREICYRLLTGPHGAEVARMTLGHDHTHEVIGAVHALRNRFAETLRIDELAAIAKMSPSAFHRQFKAITSMTPLQYQKQMRLLEARRLMAAEAVNVEAAARQVGYESPSQFSREYARMFGMPPRRDMSSLRDGAHRIAPRAQAANPA
ncbi:MAG: AraC family transcriptional regulator [Rhizomicrobium sp.]